jgi:hypothetical protein
MQAEGARDGPSAHGLLSTASGGRLAVGAGMAQAGEEFVGAGDVSGDLRAQLFWAGEFFFFAESLPEADFQPLWGRGQLSVEQVGFDGEGRAVKRRAHTNIGDGAVTVGLSIEAGARDVHAASGKKFLLWGEIQSGKGEAAPRAGSGDDFAGENERPAQKARGVSDVA